MLKLTTGLLSESKLATKKKGRQNWGSPQVAKAVGKPLSKTDNFFKFNAI